MSGVPAAADQLRKSQAGRHRLAPTSGPRAGTWQPPSCVEFWDVVSPGSLAAARRSSAQSASLREVVLLKFFFFFHFANKFSFKVVYLRLPGGRLKSGDVEPSARALLGCGTRAPCGHPRPRARLQVSGSVWDDEPGGRKSSWWDVAGRKAPRVARLSHAESPPASVLLRPFSLGALGAEPRARPSAGGSVCQQQRRAQAIAAGQFARLSPRPSGVLLFWKTQTSSFGVFGNADGSKAASRLVGNNPGTAAAPRVVGAS